MAAQVAQAANHKSPKFEAPSQFDGKLENFLGWQLSYRLYMDGERNRFDTDERKITWLLTYMNGGPVARTWAANIQEEAVQNGTARSPDYGT
jgi:hypothetical protein